jgi:hypothetical protein
MAVLYSAPDLIERIVAVECLASHNPFITNFRRFADRPTAKAFRFAQAIQSEDGVRHDADGAQVLVVFSDFSRNLLFPDPFR